MRNYDFWKNQKGKIENKEKLILILSGIFYKAFDDDARFLSAKFGFKIKIEGGYESIGFPKKVLQKYSEKLKQEKYGYKIFEKQDGDYIEILINNGKQKLNFDNTHLIFLEERKQKSDLKAFLSELKSLIEKYN